MLSSCQLCGLNSYEAHLCIFLAFPLVIYISRQVCIGNGHHGGRVFCHACLYEHVACRALILFELQLPAGYQA